jgi:hypothetical protein
MITDKLKFKIFNACSLEEQVERWRHVERVLLALDEHARAEHWNMKTFGVKNECGTIACAAGHCGMDPWFIDQGLVLEVVGDGAATFSGGCHAPDVILLFFGLDGVSHIFLNCKKRSVDVVVLEVRDHIERLKRNANRIRDGFYF